MKYLLFIPIAILAGLATLSLISQRGSAPGLKNERLHAGSDKPNAVSSEDGTPDAQRVEPLRGSKQDMLMAIRKTGGTVTSDSDDYISATYTSRLFRYVDDLELRRVRLGTQDGEAPTWHVRSGSRVGHSDMGANRRRVEQLRDVQANFLRLDPNVTVGSLDEIMDRVEAEND